MRCFSVSISTRWGLTKARDSRQKAGNDELGGSDLWGVIVKRTIGAAFAAFSLFLSILGAAAPALAQERSGSRPGFTMPSNGEARILLLRPRIKVGAQSTGGMFEPNADWTSQARDNIGAALRAAQGSLGNRIIVQEEPAGDAARVSADYMALFSSLAMSVVEYQFFPGNRLPTKLRDNRTGNFDWTLGAGVSAIPGAADADYALFIYTEDHYGSTGRKVLQLFAAMGGVAVNSGVHKGFAGLIDLRTGHLVWLNADVRMGGDVRTPEGAQRRVQQLLEDFPGRAPVQAGAAASTR